MLRLVSSTSGIDRIEAALEWLSIARDSELLVLAPTRGAADELLRASALRSGSAFGIHRRTLRQLAHELSTAELAGRSIAALTPLSMEALFTRCVHQVREKGVFEYFEPVVGTPGFPRAAARTLTELRMEGVSGQSLRGQGARAEDLARILEQYEAELADYSLTDFTGVLEAATTAAGRGDHRLVGLDLLLLDVWPETRRELALLSALVEAAPGCFATLPALTGSSEDREDDGSRRDALLVALGGEAEDVEDRVPDTGDNSLSRARRRLFRTELPTEESARDESLGFFAAPDEDRECVEIARRIQRLARPGAGDGEGVPFDRIAILLREVESYLPLLENALRRAGIPAYFSHGTVRPDPAGRAFLALLACAAEGLSASRFAEFLSLGEVAAVDESGSAPLREVEWVEPDDEQLVFKTLQPVEAPVDPGPTESLRVPVHWERLLVDASVVGGRERWQTRLDGLHAELELQLREAGSEEEALAGYLEAQLGRLETLRRFALPVISDLDAFPESASWGEWLSVLEALASRVLRNPRTVLRLLAELRPMDTVGPVGLDQVRSVVADRLSFLQAEPPARRYGRVFVATIPEALGRSFDSVFLPGLAEGRFPRKALEDPLLLDGDRERMDRGLLVQAGRFRRERALLHGALGCAESRLLTSFPRVDQTLARARVPSFYALDLLRAADGRLPDLDALEVSASAATLSWPAPDDRSQAIDDTEYDLALLAPLLRSVGDVRGKGRFLLMVNDRLDRSLRSRWHRWKSRWTEFDGLVDASEESLEILLSQLPTRRSYSPTALQTLATCPYRFLLYAIHRLRPRDRLVSIEQLDPLTRGSLFHEVQYRFLNRARELALLPFHGDFEEEMMELLDESLEGVAGDYEEKLAPAIPRIWKSEIEALRIDLRGWIRKLLDEEGAWTPVNFEYAFGLSGRAGRDRDADSVEEPATALNGVRLRGSIDLVERDWKRRAIRVTDHKTGRSPATGRLVIGGGETLQPILYALAAEDLLALEGETVEGGRLFFCTQRGGYETFDVALDTESRAAAESVFELVESSLVGGFLPAAPREGACQWCDYRSVCGPYEEIRVARKKAAALDKLETLRGRP